MSAALEEFIPTRQSLLSRLKNWDDQESWKTFFDTYWKMIYSVSRRAGLTDAEAQDVVQETIISVAKKMPTFKYDPALGSFKAWLMTITHRRIADLLRKKQYESEGTRRPREEPLGTSLLEKQADPAAFNLERVWDEEWNKHLMDAAVERVKKRVSAKHYQMFYLHVCKAIPAQKVAQKLDMKLAEVYFAKYKVALLIRKEIKRLEASII
jgi:RNA polymerase sigma factor (sigma-70 family)